MIRQTLAGHPLELLSIAEAARVLKQPIAEVERLVTIRELRSFNFGTEGEIIRVLRLDLESRRVGSKPA
ncbi:hypothetical protein Pla123a_19680 [Posidoniimonas polymericola]|uniref:Uncharacterized protein n=1 Tax=Posidoniimonas polymericola TaxID=2528002 RepID=A0A5C5YRG4_9BACT|nr:hypothetical protein [Posidoniimonas polymericola]TWT77310.1 hypothetical protein Pla123a_19680 [Posidoniimonas polymericola]